MGNMLGVMFDCSRNAVMNPGTVKQYADILKKMGYNTIMLYIEDTYEIDGEPYFGHLRGRYTKEELKDLDSYCNKIGMELIPCIQTLAHLEAIFKWDGVYTDIRDCASILLADDEKTYKLIEGMISTFAEVFTSKKIHIGMDEAEGVGSGKYQRLHGVNDAFDVMNNHLHRVCAIAEKYGMEPMIWSDMFCKLALNLDSQYDSGDMSRILEKAKLPEDVSLVYWDYYSTDYNRYVEQIKVNKAFGRKVYFAGGAWAWKGIASDNDFSIRTTKAALSACRDMGVDDVIITMWGDDGNECPKAALLPSLMYAAEVYRGNDDMDSIKSKFREFTSCNFDDFMLFDMADFPGGEYSRDCIGKKFLYSDIFTGISDFMVKKEYSAYYGNLAKKIADCTDRGAFEHVYKFYENFARVLEIKATLGIDIREAYLEGNKETLSECVHIIDEYIKRVSDFHASYEEQWFAENKPFGFEVMDIRMGGLIQRAKSCKNRILKYTSGEIKEIPELTQPILNKGSGMFWSRMVSAGRISMHM